VRDILGPAAVAAGAELGDSKLLECVLEPIVGSSGAATAEVVRISGRVGVGRRELPFTLIRKTFRPVASGRHAAAAREPAHWAYWRREILAYLASAVPSGPHLNAPRCLAVTGDAVYLADISGPAESATTAAERLGAWQAQTPILDAPWMSGHQLAQRIAVSSLDWSSVGAPETMRDIWDRRHHLLAALETVPFVVSHGDFHIRNLIASGGTTTVLDWGTLGAGPVGADLAHLALSTGEDLLAAYLVGLGNGFDSDSVLRGYHTTVVLTAASRTHWMLTRGIPVSPHYVSAVTAGVEYLNC
jgi:hypothetical protein